MTDIIDERLSSYSPSVQSVLIDLRELVHKVAGQTYGCGEIVEDLKWNQISFLTVKPKSGTTLRLDENKTGGVSIYVNCQSNLIGEIAERYPDEFQYIGTREIGLTKSIAETLEPLEHVIGLILMYHKNKRK